MYYLGIDIGSLSCDAVLIDCLSAIAASTIFPTVARNSGVVRAISSLMDCKVSVPKNQDTVGALGAAMIAKEKISSKRQTAVV